MPQIPLLHDVVVLFGAALTVIAVSSKLRLPPVVGFLITGMLVGPYGLEWINDTHSVEIFAELGIVFLLFGIGLELSTARLRALGRLLIVGGGLQVSLTLLAIMTIALLVGTPLRLAIYLGSVVALSSTAIVLKLYYERRELEAPHGQVATGILVFQDFLIVPLLLMVPLLAGNTEASGGDVALRFAGGLGVIAAVFAAGHYLLPIFLKLLVRTRIRELFVIGALFACLGGALVTEALGFSLALGAFLAGILLSESDYQHQVVAEIGPFRDVFNSMFFISVGMLVSLSFAAANIVWIAGLGLGVLVLKSAIVGLVVAILGFPLRTRIFAALGLAQVGEFSLVLISAGQDHGLLSESQYQLTIATAVLTMLLTPIMIASAPRLVDMLSARSGSIAQDSAPGAPTQLENHVVIVGYGLSGRHLTRVLRPARIPYIVVDLSDLSVQEGKRTGEPILYGDITRPEIQHQSGLAAAQVAVFAISDPLALRQGIRLARQLSPKLFLIARSRNLAEIDELRKLGADLVIAEEFESSIELVTNVLKRLHVPGSVIQAEARVLRADGYQMLRDLPPAGLSSQLIEALAAGATDTFLLVERHAATGQSLAQLGLRRRTGASVIAVVRNDQPIRNPAADLSLLAGDVLVLVGSHAEVESAFRFLELTAPPEADALEST